MTLDTEEKIGVYIESIGRAVREIVKEEAEGLVIFLHLKNGLVIPIVVACATRCDDAAEISGLICRLPGMAKDLHENYHENGIQKTGPGLGRVMAKDPEK